MAGHNHTRRQSFLGLHLTDTDIGTDTMRKKVFESIGSSMMHNDNDESSGLPGVEQMMGRDIQTHHNPSVCRSLDLEAGNRPAPASSFPTSMTSDLRTSLDETGLAAAEAQMSSKSVVEQSSTAFASNSSILAAVHGQYRRSHFVEFPLQREYQKVLGPLIDAPSLPQITVQRSKHEQINVSWVEELVNASDHEHLTPSRITATDHGKQESNIPASDLPVRPNSKLVQRSRRLLPITTARIVSTERHLHGEIQRPASSRRLLPSHSLETLRVSTALLRRHMPANQSPPTPLHSRWTEDNFVINYCSPIRSMSREIRTPTAQNLSIPLYLRGGEQPHKGGNKGSKKRVYLPSPLRNEVIYSPSTVRRASSSSFNGNKTTSDGSNRLVDTLAVTRGFAHLLSTPSTCPKSSPRLVYKDGFLVESSTNDKSHDESPVQQQQSALLTFNESMPEPAIEAASNRDGSPQASLAFSCASLDSN